MVCKKIGGYKLRSGQNCAQNAAKVGEKEGLFCALVSVPSKAAPSGSPPILPPFYNFFAANGLSLLLRGMFPAPKTPISLVSVAIQTPPYAA